MQFEQDLRTGKLKIVLLLLLGSFLATAPSAMAVDYDYVVGDVLYNPIRHEYVVPLRKIGFSDDPDENTEQVILRRIRTDGSVIGDIKLSDASAEYKGEPAVAYDPVRDRLLVVWVADGPVGTTPV